MSAAVADFGVDKPEWLRLPRWFPTVSSVRIHARTWVAACIRARYIIAALSGTARIWGVGLSIVRNTTARWPAMRRRTLGAGFTTGRCITASFILIPPASLDLI